MDPDLYAYMEKNLDRYQDLCARHADVSGRYTAAQNRRLDLQRTIFNSLRLYLDQIISHYDCFIDEQFREYKNELSNLEERLSEKPIPTLKEIPKEPVKPVSEPVFDRIKAKNARENAGLTQKRLGNNLKVSAAWVGFVEQGRVLLNLSSSGRSDPSNRERAKKYLLELKKFGYNPYNL